MWEPLAIFLTTVYWSLSFIGGLASLYVLYKIVNSVLDRIWPT